jgi:hypothetical protein
MLVQLWKDSTAWNEYHLLRVVKQLAADKWLQGLQEVLKSYTTEIIYNSLSFFVKNDFVGEILKIRKTAPAESVKVLDENFFNRQNVVIQTIFKLVKPL